MKTYNIKITGTTALLQNRFDEKAEASLGKSTRTVVRKKETPRKAAERACYQTKGGEYYMPAACITRMLSEAGSNHNGSLEQAKRLIDIAAESGADAVKFQTKDIESAFSKELLDGPYTGENSFGATYREHKQVLELSEEETAELRWAREKPR